MWLLAQCDPDTKQALTSANNAPSGAGGMAIKEYENLELADE